MSLVLGCSCTDRKETGSATGKPALEAPPAPLRGREEDDLRALIQSESPESIEDLKRELHGSVAARRWAPLGLGAYCNKERSEEILPHLLGAAAAWSSSEKNPQVEHLHTLGWAIGACATVEAEEVLRAWLEPGVQGSPPGLVEAAIIGLGALADRMGTLSERTQTSILDAASRLGRAELLLPLGRMGRLSDAVGAHILEVTGGLLTKEGAPGKRHAIFALGSAGPSAAPPLAQVLQGANFSPEERAAAAQALGRLGSAGQAALDESLQVLLARGLPIEFDRPLWIPLRATIETLESVNSSKKTLRELSSVVLPDGKERNKVAQRRRLIWLRCQAAKLLAEGRPESKNLLACDPEKGREFELAQLEVLGKERITGRRLELFLEKAKSKDPLIHQAALRMIPAHPEIEKAPELLLSALTSEQPGTQATAAQVISAYPSRAYKSEEDGEKIISQLKSLLEKPEHELAAETRAAAIKAGGALGALSLKPFIEKSCAGDVQALWEPSAQSLALLGSPGRSCPEKPKAKVATKVPVKDATIVIDSDVGELKLFVAAKDAPASAARFIKLVDDGFYNGMKIHGLRAGFAVQFGDQDGDGYQDSPSAPLPHEISPEPFSALSFGMSAFSPGSHDAQIFVVVSDAPQLTGSRVRLGRAEGPWHLLTVGDVLHSVKRSP